MTHDLMDVFMERFPHLATRASEAAEDIAEAEALLDDATAAGLPHVRFAWLALHEVQIDIDEPAAAHWLNFLAGRGFRSMAASCSAGGDAVRLHLVRPGSGFEQAASPCRCLSPSGWRHERPAA